MLLLCAMHANVQTRFNPAIDEKAPYYRLKESYRDVRGNVHSLILLNVGFDPTINALQAKKIARALTNRFENRHTKALFSERLNGLTEHEQAKADEWWNRMIQEGGIDRFDKREHAARKEAEHYIDLNTAKHTDARNVGAEWLCKQTIDKLELESFLKRQGWSEQAIHTALSALIVRTIYTRRAHHLGLLQLDPRDRVHESSAQDRPTLAPAFSLDGSAQRCPSLLWPARLLGCQYHTLWTESAGRELLLAGDRAMYVYTEVGHHRRRQSAGRKGRNATM